MFTYRLLHLVLLPAVAFLLIQVLNSTALMGGVAALQTACVTVIAALLFLPRGIRDYRFLLAWSIWAGVTLIALLQFIEGFWLDFWTCAKLCLGLGLLVFALSGVVTTLERRMGSSVDGRALGYLLITMVSLAPLWLGPLASLYAEHKWIANWAVGVSPLSYLSGLLELDYLRNDWFYRNAPYGGLQFVYPSQGLYSFLLLLVVVVCMLTSYSQRR